MRKQDKATNMAKANILAEARFRESSTLNQGELNEEVIEEETEELDEASNDDKGDDKVEESKSTKKYKLTETQKALLVKEGLLENGDAEHEAAASLDNLLRPSEEDAGMVTMEMIIEKGLTLMLKPGFDVHPTRMARAIAFIIKDLGLN